MEQFQILIEQSWKHLYRIEKTLIAKKTFITLCFVLIVFHFLVIIAIVTLGCGGKLEYKRTPPTFGMSLIIKMLFQVHLAMSRIRTHSFRDDGH
jgi:hypothetical protein